MRRETTLITQRVGALGIPVPKMATITTVPGSSLQALTLQMTTPRTAALKMKEARVMAKMKETRVMAKIVRAA